MSDAPIPDLSFPAGYYERASRAITTSIEQNWALWTSSQKRYMLVTKRDIVENDTRARSGRVTGWVDFHISADSVEDLKRIWASLPYILSTTYQHFIVDTHERKVVDLLSICA